MPPFARARRATMTSVIASPTASDARRGARKNQNVDRGAATVTPTRWAIRCCWTSVSVGRYEETAFAPSWSDSVIFVRVESLEMRADATWSVSIASIRPLYVSVFAVVFVDSPCAIPEGAANAPATPKMSAATKARTSVADDFTERSGLAGVISSSAPRGSPLTLRPQSRRLLTNRREERAASRLASPAALGAQTAVLVV